jgi:hypothetical protein
MMMIVAGLFHIPNPKTNKGISSSFFALQKEKNLAGYLSK